MPLRQLISVDFDGTLHDRQSDWVDARTVTDGPVEGAVQWLRDLIDSGRFDIAIFSCRNGTEGAADVMRAWLAKEGLEERYFEHLTFPADKPWAAVYLDDRAMAFDGTFPTVDELEAFKPWNR